MPLRHATAALLALTLLTACDGCSGDDSSSSDETTTTGESTTSGEEGEPGEPTSDPGPRPDIRVEIRLDEGDDGRAVTFSVQNHDLAPARLAPRVIIERQDGDAFAPVEDIRSVLLRFDCGSPPDDCVPLAPGAELEPPPWTGDIGDAQCACEECSEAPPGSYRVVLTTCDGAHRFESDAIEIR